MYFLVADEDIPTHIATDVTLDQKCAAQNRYYYYLNQTYDGVNNLVINSDKDLADLVAFMLENEIYSMDVVFDKETYGSYSSVSGYINFPAITNAIKYAKTTNGIDAANIMYPSMLFQNNIYYSNKIGLVYNISLVNLDKLEPQAA